MQGGGAISEVLRRAWSCFTRKQWLIAYPFALSVIGTLAFLALYAIDGQPLALSSFFHTDFVRQEFVHDQVLSSVGASPTLLVALAAGIVFSLFAALIMAPLYRAIAGYRYPLAPRGWTEASRLFVFYLLVYAVTWLAPSTLPGDGFPAALVLTVAHIFAIVVVFADYAIVFENIGVIAGIRRSATLVARRPAPVIVTYVILILVLIGIRMLYALYFDGEGPVFILLPLSHMLIESLVLLLGNLFLIYLYEDLRRGRPA